MSGLAGCTTLFVTSPVVVDSSWPGVGLSTYGLARPCVDPDRVLLGPAIICEGLCQFGRKAAFVEGLNFRRRIVDKSDAVVAFQGT